MIHIVDKVSNAHFFLRLPICIALCRVEHVDAVFERDLDDFLFIT